MPVGGEDYNTAPHPPLALQDSCVGEALVDRATLAVWRLLTDPCFLAPPGLCRLGSAWGPTGSPVAWQGPSRSGGKSWWGQGCASGIAASYHAKMDMFCAQKALPADP